GRSCGGRLRRGQRGGSARQHHRHRRHRRSPPHEGSSHGRAREDSPRDRPRARGGAGRGAARARRNRRPERDPAGPPVHFDSRRDRPCGDEARRDRERRRGLRDRAGAQAAGQAPGGGGKTGGSGANGSDRLRERPTARAVLRSYSTELAIVRLRPGDLKHALAGAALAEAGVNPKTIEIECPAGSTVDPGLTRALVKIHSLGVRLASEEYANVAQSSAQLTFDTLKIPFPISRDHVANAKAISAVVAKARATGARVVADSVESTAQEEALAAL